MIIFFFLIIKILINSNRVGTESEDILFMIKVLGKCKELKDVKLKWWSSR